MDKIMESIVSNSMFGMALSILMYAVGLFLNKKLKTPVCNPLLIAIALVIAVLQVFHIPLESYLKGGDVISMFLAPATAVLAYSIYHQIHLLKKYWLPILVGCLVGAVTSIGSVYLLCRLFKLDQSLLASMLPKSVTTPIAMEVSSALGGTPSITVAAVVVTGILGAMLSPLFVKLLRLKNKVAIGVAIGSSSHAVGTSKAVEMGEAEGAMSGIAIGVSGILTVLISLFL